MFTFIFQISEQIPLMDIQTYEHLQNNIFKYIESTCLQNEGIYRIPGSLQQATKLYLDYVQGNYSSLIREINDSNTATSLLKFALKHLKEPVIPVTLYPALRACVFLQEDPNCNGDYLYNTLQLILTQLPEQNKNIVITLFNHLNKVAEYQDKNQMSIENLCTVFGPTLLKSIGEGVVEELTVNPKILMLMMQVIQ